MLTHALLLIAMTWNYCTLTARKIRRLGYAPQHAIWFAGFFFISLLSLCAAGGLLVHYPDDDREWTAGSGRSPAGARAGRISPVFFRIRRY
jgi:hypothetical protein